MCVLIIVVVALCFRRRYDNAPEDSPLKDKYYRSLYSVKAEIDLNCLNERKPNCNSYDLDGVRYKNINGKFVSEKEWEKFRPYKRNSN